MSKAAFDPSPHLLAERVSVRSTGDIAAPMHAMPSDGVVRAGLMGLVSFGLLPAILWPLRFSRLIEIERARLAALAQWLGATHANPEVAQLDQSLRAIRFRPALYLVSAACCAGLLFLFSTLGAHFGVGNDLLWRSTYHFHHADVQSIDDLSPIRYLLAQGQLRGAALRTLLFGAWTCGLSLAYVTHWVQVQLHARSVRRFLNSFNRIAIHEGLSPVFLQPLGAGVRPLWVLGAMAMVACNAPWGIALMLTGAVQRRYVVWAGPLMRKNLAARVSDMHLLCRPAMNGPSAPARWVQDRDRCGTEGCRCVLPAGARFCPRCGRRGAGPIDRVA